MSRDIGERVGCCIRALRGDTRAAMPPFIRKQRVLFVGFVGLVGRWMVLCGCGRLLMKL